MVRDELSVMSAFLAVADERSFTKAAKRLGVAQSALSHAIRGLEEQVRCTTARAHHTQRRADSGRRTVARGTPASANRIRGALEKLSGLRDTPRGRLRLLVPRLAVMTVLGPKVGQFAREYPDVVLDVTTDDERLDLVAGGFDAGIQYGEFIQQDMVAVRVSPDHHPAIVGSPSYFESHPTPTSPHDLLQHPCINFRHGSDGIYRWELDKRDQSLTVGVNGPLITNDIGLLIRAALDGVGLAFVSEEHAAPHLANGALVRVLEDWCPPFPGFFLYYPSRRQHPAALTALIETLRV